MKFKRSERLVDMTALLLANPHKLFTMNDFTTKYNSAKSSISEDVAILSETFSSQDLGKVNTYPGVNGGFKYIPYISIAKQAKFVDEICELLYAQDRILPGGYMYISDLIEDPKVLKKIGRIIASYHADEHVDYVMTVATKGIPIAQAVSYELNIPMIIAKKESKVTEGSTLSVKYTSQSSPKLVKSMEVVQDSIKPASKIILVDDFLRGGGTLVGMNKLVEIFESTVIAQYILCENLEKNQLPVENVRSLITIENLESESNISDLKISRGSLFR